MRPKRQACCFDFGHGVQDQVDKLVRLIGMGVEQYQVLNLEGLIVSNADGSRSQG